MAEMIRRRLLSTEVMTCGRQSICSGMDLLFYGTYEVLHNIEYIQLVYTK